MKTDLAIQIVNYNTKNYLEQCLDDLLNDLQDTSLNYEINIVDNHSDDDLSALQEKYRENKQITFYFSNKNLGFGAGHNLLASKTDAKSILILNPDLKFFEKNTIDRLVARLASENRIRVVGPKLLTDQFQPQIWDHGEVSGLPAWIALNAGDSYWRNRDIVCDVAWVCGAALLIDKEQFAQVNGFDENFFLYREEEDLCMRIRNSGGKIVYDPTVKILHYESVVARKSIHMSPSTKYFLNKHFKGRKREIRRKFFGLFNRLVQRL